MTPPPLAGQLAAWLDWRDAIALSQALSSAPTPARPEATVAARDWAQAALQRLRAELAASFADRQLVGEAPSNPADAALALDDALAPFRLHHAQQQRLMAARVATLRERLRTKLMECGGALARIAELDAVMDTALAPRERQAQAALAHQLPQLAAALHPAADWPQRLWAQVQQALAAELELRLQPVLGLLDALQDPDDPAR